ncbi:MAG: nitrilase-related carbon-nitrogen hydrolase [Candidatus Binataceae bacterium]
MLNTRMQRFVAAVLSGVMISQAASLHPWWPIAWIAPIPLLAAAFSTSRGETRVLAAIAALIGCASTTSYYLEVTGPVPALVLIPLTRVIVTIFIVGATRAAVVKWRHWLSIFVYPSLSAGIDMLVGEFSRNGTAGSLAYSQMNAIPVIQIAAFAGTPGIVFIVSLFAATAAIVWCRRGDLKGIRPGYVGATIVVLAAVGFGALRVALAPVEPLMPVGLAVIDTPANHEASSPDAPLWKSYGEAIAALARQGAKLVILPEKVAAFDPAQADQMRQALARFAAANRVFLLTGVTIVEPDHKENRAWFFSPEGAFYADYSKQHLVVGFEDAFVPGRKIAVRIIEGNLVGIAICKDMDFPHLGRDYGMQDVQMMMVPAWDFGRDDWLHSRMAILRGVEGDFSIIRAARNGMMTVSDRYGRVLYQASSSATPYGFLIAEAPLGPGVDSVFDKIGNAFGWAVLAFGLLAGLWSASSKGPKARDDEDY